MSSETSLSQEFIKRSKEECKTLLWIKKMIDNLEKGIPDIYAVYDGMPLFAESKKIDELLLINNKKFESIQIHQLKERSKSKAFCIGLLFLNNNETRYVMWNEIPDNGHVTKEQFLNAEVFSWQTVLYRWRQMVSF